MFVARLFSLRSPTSFILLSVCVCVCVCVCVQDESFTHTHTHTHTHQDERVWAIESEDGASEDVRG